MCLCPVALLTLDTPVDSLRLQLFYRVALVALTLLSVHNQLLLHHAGKFFGPQGRVLLYFLLLVGCWLLVLLSKPIQCVFL